MRARNLLKFNFFSKVKKNEENVEEYTEVDTLSSQVYNKVAVGGESIKIADIDSKSYFAKMKDNWPESWKNTSESCEEENKEITNPASDLEENSNCENDNSDIIPDNLEETTEEEMLLDDITEIEKLRIVSDLEDDSVTFDNLQESFFNSNPFDSDDENDEKEIDLYNSVGNTNINNLGLVVKHHEITI